LGNGFSIINIARCHQHIEQFASIIDDQVQFEAKEPAGRGFASLGQTGKDFVGGDALIETNI